MYSHPIQGLIELSISCGYAVGAPIGGGLQEVRDYLEL